jgi:hypothetical protein
MLSGVLELDPQGNILHAGIRDMPVYDPSLLLGFPPGLLTGAAIASVLPLTGGCTVLYCNVM